MKHLKKFEKFEFNEDWEEDEPTNPQKNRFWTILTEEPYFTNSLRKIGNPIWSDPKKEHRVAWVKQAKKICVGFNGERWFFGSARYFSNHNFINMGELGKTRNI